MNHVTYVFEYDHSFSLSSVLGLVCMRCNFLCIIIQILMIEYLRVVLMGTYDFFSSKFSWKQFDQSMRITLPDF